ncbi:MAG: hypothetical protein AB1792_11750 [Candidatus Zixiibacteriota bacterium]
MLSRESVGRWCGVGVVVAALLTGCGDSNVEKVDRAKTQPGTSAGQMSGSETVPAEIAGIAWTVPESWVVSGPRPMRVATYQIGEGAVSAECAVFYFGLGQGGDVQANIDRWIGQFVQPDGSASQAHAQVGAQSVAGLKVTTVGLTGTYAGGMGGPMSGQQVEHPGWRLVGAIVEAPQGPVFFKLTGPDATVTAARADFDRMMASVKRK